MSKEKGRIVAIVGSVAVMLALCVFGGPYATEKIRADHEVHLQTQTHLDTLRETQKATPEAPSAELDTAHQEDDEGANAVGSSAANAAP